MTTRVWGLVLAIGCALATVGCGDDDSGDGGGRSNSGETLAACEMEGMGMFGMECEGVDEYTDCFLNTCGVQDCLDEPCADYVECVENADDPCNNDCMQSSECESCFTEQASCIGNMCIGLLMCGETTSGGACDQLDDCCAEQPEQMRNFCQQAAAGARAAGGDAICMSAMEVFCM